MRSRIIIGALVALFLALFGLASYGYYTELKNSEARIIQLEQTVKAQQQKIDELSNPGWEMRVTERLNGLENVTQPLFNGTPILMCKRGVLTDVSCDRVTFSQK